MTEKINKSDEKRKSIFDTLSKIDVSDYVEKKKGGRPLTYLSWANAWSLVKKYYPQANYSIVEFPEYIRTQSGWQPTGRTVDYRHTDAGYEVETTVEIEGEKYSSKLFVMDTKYKAIIGDVTYFDINKTQQRALVKALAFAGLGLNIYAGEDLVDEPQKATKQRNTNAPKTISTVKKLTIEELKKYQVTAKGKNGIQKVLLLTIFKSALAGNQNSSKWLAENHDPQTNSAINQLKAYYVALRKEREKKKAEEERQQRLEQATKKIENSNAPTEPTSNLPLDDINVTDPDINDEKIDPDTPQNEDSEDVFKALSKYTD